MRCGWKTTWALVLGVLLPAWGMVPPFPLLASGGGVAEAAQHPIGSAAGRRGQRDPQRRA